MSTSELPINSDMILRVDTLKDRAGTAITSATVTLESIKDHAGANVSGMTFPASFTHQGAGVYEIALPDGLGVVANQTYSALVKAVSATLQREWTHTIKAVVGTL